MGQGCLRFDDVFLLLMLRIPSIPIDAAGRVHYYIFYKSEFLNMHTNQTVGYPSNRSSTFTEYDQLNFAEAVAAGLSRRPKSLPPAYHYDDEGSRLFKRITDLPEYYVTRCECDALERNKVTIADLLGNGPMNLIEFGPGDGSKTRSVIEYLLERKVAFRYVPIDISGLALDQLAADFRIRYPALEVHCIAADYVAGIQWLSRQKARKNMAFFLGSNIGNFPPAEGRLFLRRLRNSLNRGDMLIIGFDLRKEIDVIYRAYNDSKNVTAEFNLNMLRRINRELNGEFDLSQFRYKGTYCTENHCVQSYLVSLASQDVYVGKIDRWFHFEPQESIHTENSYKYRESDIEQLAAKTGFAISEQLYDARRFFVDSVWLVP